MTALGAGQLKEGRAMPSLDMLQQLPTLIGVAVGAVASFATTATIERSRWKRQQKVRWDDRRMAAYADYGNAVKNVIQLSCRVLAAQGLPANVDPLPGEAGLQQLAAAELERAARWEAVLLLGSRMLLPLDVPGITKHGHWNGWYGINRKMWKVLGEHMFMPITHVLLIIRRHARILGSEARFRRSNGVTTAR
jgi:hypothetical protein